MYSLKKQTVISNRTVHSNNNQCIVITRTTTPQQENMPTTRAKKSYINHVSQQGRAGRVGGSLPGTKRRKIQHVSEELTGEIPAEELHEKQAVTQKITRQTEI